MKMPESSTKNKILQIASGLFYSKGFVNTGIEEIIVSCNIKRPTLYYYFNSKVELGLAYLDFQEKEFIGVLEKLGERNHTLQDFFAAWTILVKRAAREKNFYGCPFSSFAAQLNPDDKPVFEKKLHHIKNRWLETVSYILKQKSKKKNKRELDYSAIATEVMVIYVGTSNLYRMTGQIEFLNAMGNQFEQIATRCRE
ncbi:MAG: TetR/AcrR family transcriptional regulator [Leptospiraceae bacterium]|nr:TetR/AcrR family transcriptional regulator [Leptospiraceae bacterium]